MSEAIDPRISHATYAHEEGRWQVNWVGDVADPGHAQEMDHADWNPRDNVHADEQENSFGQFNLE